MLTAVILVCLAGTPQNECTRDTALAVIRTPITSANPTTCFMQAQAYVAETTRVRTGDTLSIACVKKFSLP